MPRMLFQKWDVTGSVNFVEGGKHRHEYPVYLAAFPAQLIPYVWASQRRRVVKLILVLFILVFKLRIGHPKVMPRRNSLHFSYLAKCQ